MKIKKRINKKPCLLVCDDCGMSVLGISPKHAETNLKAHKKSKRHKAIIKAKR